MFVSHKYRKYLGYKGDIASFEYELIDSEFGTVFGNGGHRGRGFEVAVIQEYSKRKLNVGKNLMLAFVWYSKLYPDWSIQELLNFNKKHNPLFQQYEEDIQKYYC